MPAVDGSLSPAQVPRPAPPVPPAPAPKGLGDQLRTSGQQFFGSLVDQAGKTASSALFSRAQAKIDGRARKDYLDSAFPGTSPWEQLGAGGGGAAPDYQAMAAQSEELAQRERESKRNSHVALSTARVQAAQNLASAFVANGNYEAAERMLKAAGIFDSSLGIDPKMMAGGKVASEMARMEQETRRSSEMLPYDKMKSAAEMGAADASADKSRVDAMMAPLRLALDDWIARDKGGHISTEIRGVVGLISETLSGLGATVTEDRFRDVAAKVLRNSDLPGDVIDDLLKKMRSP